MHTNKEKIHLIERKLCKIARQLTHAYEYRSSMEHFACEAQILALAAGRFLAQKAELLSLDKADSTVYNSSGQDEIQIQRCCK